MKDDTLIPLASSHRDPPVGAEEVGLADPEHELEITLVLRRRSKQSPPAQPWHALGREEFESSYGADPVYIEAVRAFASAHELAVVSVSPPSRRVVLRGTVDRLQTAFGVSLRKYRAAYGEFVGRVGPLQIPETLSAAVLGVFGLDNRRQAESRSVFRHRHTAIARALGNTQAYSARAVAWAYNFPLQLTGTGQRIGIVEFGGGYLNQDLDEYFQVLGVGRPEVSAVGVDGITNSPTPPDENGDTPDGEVMLDIEVAGSVAPGAAIVVYFAPFTERGWIDVLSTAIHDTANPPSILSISWGWAEGHMLWTEQAVLAVNEALRDAAALGVTVLAASGDDGSSDDLEDGKAHVDFPASSPYVLGCGGTRMIPQLPNRPLEAVWNNGPRSADGGASGGGASQYFAVPSWQLPWNPPPSVTTGKAGRGVPDLAANADPNTGYNVYVRGRWSVAGGTSAVAPLMAALVALCNQSLDAPVGYLSPLLYQSCPRTAFNDIVVGTNDTTGRVGGYAAGAGWDACTGLGSVDGTALLTFLAGSKAASLAADLQRTVSWHKVPGTALSIAGGFGSRAWAILSDESGDGAAIRSWNGTDWEPLPGQSASGDGYNAPLLRRTPGASHFNPGPMITINRQGMPIVCDRNGSIFEWVDSGWVKRPGVALSVAADDQGRLWAVSSTGANKRFLFRFDGSTWHPTGIQAERVSRGASGPYVVGPAGDLFEVAEKSLKRIPGTGSLVAGKSDALWAISAPFRGTFQGTVYKLLADVGWIPVGTSANDLSVDGNGDAWSITSPNASIYTTASM